MYTTIKTEQANNGVRANRKEDAFTEQYTIYTSTGQAIITARIYSTQARNYACVWLNVPSSMINPAMLPACANGLYNAGGAYAGGYGYHRPSQALQSALERAGITLSEDIGGRGEQAMETALMAIARDAVAPRYRKGLFLGRAHA